MNNSKKYSLILTSILIYDIICLVNLLCPILQIEVKMNPLLF